MAEIKSPEAASPSKLGNQADEHLILYKSLFDTEKALIKLREGLPVEKQESFTRQIQFLSKKRLALISSLASQDFTKDSLVSLSSLQEEYNDCLHSMISEIVEEHGTLDYNPTETAGKLLRRQSTKGMITGNFNEVIEGMDRVLLVGENLIIQGYQKLFIDTNSLKDKLQAVIDDRRNLPVSSKPMETLIVKQQFLERQLGCLLSLFEEANTLTHLITKLQEFDTRQIQFQKTSQVTVDAFKKFFYKPDVRKSERRRTYLTVNYANPDNTKEGLDILRDQVNSIIRNINVVCDMEDAKVRAINKSDLGDTCDSLFEENQQLFIEEKEILQDIFDSLAKYEENSELQDRADALMESLAEFGEKPATQLETIKFFVERGLHDQAKRVELLRLLRDLKDSYDEKSSKNSALVDKLQAEVSNLLKDNNALKAQVQSQVIDKISEGTNSLKELFDYQEQLKKTIQESLEYQLKEKMVEIIMIGCGTAEVLLGINPDEDSRIRLLEYETDYNKANSLTEFLDLLGRYQSLTFRLICKLGTVSEGHIHANLSGLKQARTAKEARECLSGRPAEYPLTAMDRTLTEILKSYLASLEDNKGSIESVLRKQNALGRLFKDFKG